MPCVLARKGAQGHRNVEVHPPVVVRPLDVERGGRFCSKKECKNGEDCPCG